ncbi:hypothetical protein L218DRAFT_866086, partial [Marasmius fiardii PR-910]
MLDDRIRVISFNVAKHYMYLDVFLESCKYVYDVIFIQEPPWRLIRHAPSAKDPLGESVVGMPNHPDWTAMVRHWTGEGERPHVAAYVSKRIATLCPSTRFDVIDDRDIIILSLTSKSGMSHLLNMYSDDNGTAIRKLSAVSGRIPELSYMGGDFNCHSSEWDPSFQGGTGGQAEELLLLAASLGLGRSECENPGPTFIPRTQGSRSLVLDLVFVTSDKVLSTKSRRELDLKRLLDHVPVSVVLDLGRSPLVEIRTLPKGGEQEEAFLEHLSDGLATFASLDMSSPELLALGVELFGNHMREAWNQCSKKSRITRKSKPWWNQGCLEALDSYHGNPSRESWGEFRRVVKSSKHTFFDNQVKEIASTNARLWDLMSWIQQRKLPPTDAISFQGWQCRTLDELWQALHGTYNAAAEREVDLSFL